MLLLDQFIDCKIHNLSKGYFYVRTSAEIKSHAAEEFVASDSIVIPDCQL